MVQEGDDKYNFDITNKPIDPLTGKAINCWYMPGQTWTSQFGELATTVDECRAELVGAYLMDDPELLSLFGFTADSEITNDDRGFSPWLRNTITTLTDNQLHTTYTSNSALMAFEGYKISTLATT